MLGVYPVANMTGSPPRVWGIRRTGNEGNETGRFTPTRVGNTDENAQAQ